MHLLALAAFGVAATGAAAQQAVFDTPYDAAEARFKHDPTKWTVFNNTIKRVAVIGAGMCSILAHAFTAQFIQHDVLQDPPAYKLLLLLLSTTSLFAYSIGRLGQEEIGYTRRKSQCANLTRT